MASVAKRKHEQIGETINSLSTESDGHVAKCRRFMKTGYCDYGDRCLFSHDMTVEQYNVKPDVPKGKGAGKGTFKGKGKGQGKGSGEIGKGGKGATKSDVHTYYDRDMDNFCSRCNRYHKGRIGND